MRRLMGLFVGGVTAGLVAMTPGPVAGQVGTCMVCDYSEINPCTGSHNGAEQCAQQGPDDCDLYGAVCGPQTLLDVGPDGTLRTGAPSVMVADHGLKSLSTLAVAPRGDAVSSTFIRGCDGEILHRTYTVRSATLARSESRNLSLSLVASPQQAN